MKPTVCCVYDLVKHPCTNPEDCDEKIGTHLHEKSMPEHLAEAVTVFDKRSAERPTEIGQDELELGMRLMDRLKQYRREEASQ